MIWRTALATTLLGACSFGGPSGMTPDDATKPPPDGGPCLAASVECVDMNTLRRCPAKDAQYKDEPCSWGCIAGTSAHCGQITPTAGAVMTGDVATSPDLQDVTFMGATLLMTSNGNIGPTGNPSMLHNNQTGTQNGIDYQHRTGTGAVDVAVFRFKSLTISTELDLGGTNAIAIVADGEIRIDALVDARGPCTGTNAGPGGLAGGLRGVDGNGPGKGTRGTDNNLGAGGAGNGGVGGNGGDGTGGMTAGAGGVVNGDDMITMLIGGSGGGGGGGGNNAGPGGGGGGALQIVSNTKITITAQGGVNAGGCGGHNGSAANDAGGGGGAGGVILLEAPAIEIAGGGKLAVNGGGGGGGNAGNTTSAPQATLDRTPAPGGTGMADGGKGGAAAISDGEQGKNDNNKGGGGGGGIGRIRFNTRTGTTTIDAAAILSPAITDATRCTQGSATIK